MAPGSPCQLIKSCQGLGAAFFIRMAGMSFPAKDETGVYGDGETHPGGEPMKGCLESL